MQIYDRSIVLVGIMGSGKTTAGRELAKLLNMPFADSDAEVERLSGLSIPEIFEKHGEPEFRRQERGVMLSLLEGKPQVIASGGGVFLQPELKESIINHSFSVWLKPNFNVLLERNKRDLSQRPLLKNSDIETRLQQLIDVRYPVYAEADITLVTDGQTQQDTARLIKMEIDRLLSRKGNSAVHV